MSSWAINTLRRLCADISTYRDGRNLWNLIVYRDIVTVMQQAIGFDSNREQACELIRQVLVIIDEMEALQWTQQWHTAPRSVMQ